MFRDFPDVPLLDYGAIAAVCHECPDAPCERDCLVPGDPFELCWRERAWQLSRLYLLEAIGSNE